MKRIFFAVSFFAIFALVSIFNFSCASSSRQNENFYDEILFDADSLKLEIPLCKASDKKNSKKGDTHQIVRHEGYTLCYREKFEQAEWVAYTLDAEKLRKNAARKNNFREDPDVKTYSAQLQDYRHSGYDRGHLAPAADMAYSESAMSESFFMSNISPQAHAFNAGIWLRLEEYVRTLASENEKIFVATGPLFEKDFYETIGLNRVAVPEFFYKAILTLKKGEFKMYAFIVPNESSKEEIWRFRTTVDEIEERTGIDFFWQLDDEIENALEAGKR